MHNKQIYNFIFYIKIHIIGNTANVRKNIDRGNVTIMYLVFT